MVEESTKGILKPTMDETYIILLEDNDKPIVFNVVEVNETGNIVIMNDSKDKKFIFELDNDVLILSSTKLKYKILDIDRVLLFDLDILKKDKKQLDKQLTSDIIKDLDISLEEIKEIDIVYTDTELKEILLSELINSYNAYDKYKLIKELTELVDNYLLLKKEKTKEYLYNLDQKNSFPKWLIPIVDNPLKIYNTIGGDSGDSGDSSEGGGDEAFNELNEIIENILPSSNYYQGNQYLLDNNRPIEPSLSEVGLNTSNHSDNYLRDCLQNETCLGIKGNYKYDKRKNINSIYQIYDGIKKNIYQPDNLNIVGFLYIPDDKLIYGLHIQDTNFNMKEKSIIQNVINHKLKEKLNLKNQPMINKLFEYDIELKQLDSFIHYRLSERFNIDTFNELIKKLIPSVDKLLQYTDDKIKSKLINYKDIKTLFIKYGLDPDKLSHKDKYILNNLITDNVNSYISKISKLSNVDLNIKKKELSIHRKIELAKSYIMKLHDIVKRNEYLKIFIKNFTRESLSSNENKLWLYNIFTNEKILCKHYLYSSCYHKDKDAHKSMISIYGRPPLDGSIYCKNCGEYLCPEEFSAFDGFNDETPIQLREVMVDDNNILEEYDESTILLIKLMSKNIGVSIEDHDIKLILDIQKSFNQDIIANIRYDSMNIADDHPIIKDIMKKYEKEKNKKKLIIKDIKNFRTFLKNTNKIVTLISSIILIIQTSIPKYNLKNNFDFTFIKFNSLNDYTFNKKVLDYCLQKINKNIEIYKLDELWNNYKQLTDEYKVYDVIPLKEQIINIVNYLLSPQYPIILTRLIEYSKFLKSSNQVFIKSEWAIFKPLRNNKQIQKVDELLISKNIENKDYYILNYNNYPVENVSLIDSIDNDKYIYELLNIPISEIMINKAFLLLFKLGVSNYGKSKYPIHSIDLHIERFLQTIPDKDEIEMIFKKHGWTSSLKKGYLSFKDLRTKIIPDIINHYQKSKQLLEPCYDLSKECNKFVHINVNNYELFLLKSNSKRYYKYNTPTVFPDGNFEDINDDFKNKIFKRYCKDPSDNIIVRNLNTNYLGKCILTISELDIKIPDIINNYEINLEQNNSNFKKILDSIQSKTLDLFLYVKPKEYTIDDYNIDIKSQYYNVESRILNLLKDNKYYEIGEDHPIVHQLTYYINKQGETNSTTIRDIETAFSSLTTDLFKDNISEFISTCESKKHKKRFENIFINTSESINISQSDRNTLEGDGFRYRNLRKQDINKILELFTDDPKLTSDISNSYIYRIKYILSNFNNNHIASNYIPKHWRLSDNNKILFKKYISNNYFVLHSDIFKNKITYKGFYEYDCDYIFNAMLQYILPFTNNLENLKVNEFSLINPIILFIINKYILLFIINKLIEFNEKIKQENEEILSLLEECIRDSSKYSDKELNIIEVSQLSENIIMDLLTEIMQTHYDSKWIISNTNSKDLSQRLSKQKEREKQNVIHKLDTMSDDKRATTMELQRMGITNQFKESSEKNAEFIESNEHQELSDTDRYTKMNELFKGIELGNYVSDMYNGETSELNNQTPYIPEEEQDGYYNENDIDEDGQMGDEYHEFHDEDLLNNPFN